MPRISTCVRRTSWWPKRRWNNPSLFPPPSVMPNTLGMTRKRGAVVSNAEVSANDAIPMTHLGHSPARGTARKSVVEGKGVSVSVDFGGGRIIKKQTKESEGEKALDYDAYS